jgi:hypothetical protein
LVDKQITPDFEAKVVVCCSAADMQAAIKPADVIVTLGSIVAEYPFLTNCEKPLVLDLYDPFLLAGLHKFADRPIFERLVLNERYRCIHQTQLGAADFMLCASEKQRDYWLGMLTAVGRINPFTSDDDPALRKLIDVVPFGLPAVSPAHSRPVLKGAHPAIAASDKVLLWGGGIWNWFDAPTIIRAMAIISRQRSDVKLFFMGINHPNMALPKMQAVEQAINLSKELELYDKCVFFNDWVPYNERHNYLLEADIGVSLHLDHVETRFAFRTRFLDYLWAGLPIMATEGDILSETVQTWDLGKVVKPGDVPGVVKAVLDLLNTPNLRAVYGDSFHKVAAQYRWEAVARPLVDFCLAPHTAADKAYLRRSAVGRWLDQWGPLAGKAGQAIRQQGPGGLLHKVAEYLRWRLNWR